MDAHPGVFDEFHPLHHRRRNFPILDAVRSGAKGFDIFIYFLLSFCTRFGPKSTALLITAKAYPAPLRPITLGRSAAVEQYGALGATDLYNHIGCRT